MFKQRATILIFLAIALLLTAVFVFAQTPTSEATLAVNSGNVSIQQNNTILLIFPQSTQVEVTAGNIVTVQQGDTITLAPGATAQLTLLDGGQVDLSEEAHLNVSELVTNEQTYRVQLNLLAGRALNRVVKLLNADDSYKINTPSSTAAVRGTVFTAQVLSSESSYYAVTEGVVEVQMAEQRVNILPGEEVTAVSGQPLNVQPQQNNVDSVPSAAETLPETNEATTTPSAVVTVAATNTATATAANTTETTTATLAANAVTPPATLLPTATASPNPVLRPNVTASPVPPTRPNATVTVIPTTRPHSTATAVAAPPSDPMGTAVPANPTATAVPPSATNTAVAPTATSVPPAATLIPPNPTATAVPPDPTATTEALVTICHIPPGNPENAQTITVGVSAVAAHLAHGDILGSCP